MNSRHVFIAVTVYLTTSASACALDGWRGRHLTAGALVESIDGEGLPRGGVVRSVFPRGLELTMVSEGWSPRLYEDVAKYCTIGFGHLVAKRRCDGTEPEEFRAGIARPRGEELLVDDMASARSTVTNHVTIKLTDGQYAALVDFVFNVGSANFRYSTLLKYVNGDQQNMVAAQFRRWILAGGKPWPGLQARRDKEVELYFEGLPVSRGPQLQDQNLTPIDIRSGESR